MTQIEENKKKEEVEIETQNSVIENYGSKLIQELEDYRMKNLRIMDRE